MAVEHELIIKIIDTTKELVYATGPLQQDLATFVIKQFLWNKVKIFIWKNLQAPFCNVLKICPTMHHKELK